MSAWRWIPTLYFAQGLPYVAAMTLAMVMYKNLGLGNVEAALYTSWLYLPWVIKPLWSPLVELLGAKRGWIIAMQCVVGAGFAALALALPAASAVQWTLVLFWLVAFGSATHDIAADGFYLLALPPHQQAAFSGVRSALYRLSMIAGQGGLVSLAGLLQQRWADVRLAWTAVFGALALVFAGVALYHAWVLPRPSADRGAEAREPAGARFIEVFAAFFRRPDIGRVLAFLLLFRLAEAQSLKMVLPFLLDGRGAGGLGLSNVQVGGVYGTAGVIALTLGGLLGGWAVSRQGLRRWLWPMLLAVHVPNLVFVALAWSQPGSLTAVSIALALEQFGYGFGFTAYMLYMILVAEGPYRTAHYAICTGFMAMGMMLPGMASGWIESRLGYERFFLWVCIATLPSFWAAARVRIPADFGRKVD